MLIDTKARIGVFSIALGAYLPQFPSLVPEFESQYEDFKKRIPDTVELIDGGLVTTKEKAMEAGDKFRAADVDLVILQLLTYATSYNMLPAVRDLDVPVVLVNLQKKKAPDYANTDTATWLGTLYACGAVGEMVADLERAGKRHAVITGVVEGGDPEVDAEIADWCRAAQVRRRFRSLNLAQIGRPYPGMMDLYIDETNLYHRMWLYTKQFDWEKMWAIADNITDEDAIRAEAQEILDTFEIEGGGTVEKVWEMAKYVLAFKQWVHDEQIGFVASHYDGFAQGKAGVLDSMLIPAFSMLIKDGVACAVEGDIKVSMAMSILKTISGMGQLSEMYSIDFEKDICIIGHSGSGDADISKAKKPTMRLSDPVLSPPWPRDLSGHHPGPGRPLQVCGGRGRQRGRPHLHLWRHQHAHPLHLRRAGLLQPLERGRPHPPHGGGRRTAHRHDPQGREDLQRPRRHHYEISVGADAIGGP